MMRGVESWKVIVDEGSRVQSQLRVARAAAEAMGPVWAAWARAASGVKQQMSRTHHRRPNAYLCLRLCIWVGVSVLVVSPLLSHLTNVFLGL